jgi:hypothetical protein
MLGTRASQLAAVDSSARADTRAVARQLRARCSQRGLVLAERERRGRVPCSSKISMFP